MNELDSAIFHAIHNGGLRELRSALAAGANPNVRGLDGERPLTLAARHPRGARLVKVLLEHGARVEFMNAVGQTPLMVAVVARGRETARLLLEAGANVNRINRKRETALTYSVVWRRLKLVDLLLQHGADVELPPPPGWSPLMYAALEGDSRIVALLLKAGANRKRKDRYGRTAHMIAREAHRWTASRLLERPIVSRARVAPG
jgi:ankyrin repeat protein